MTQGAATRGACELGYIKLRNLLSKGVCLCFDWLFPVNLALLIPHVNSESCAALSFLPSRALLRGDDRRREAVALMGA